ncbi:hypothetical protein [Candidatus Lokiarchaeum ossiferum]|uniref:hypothetical protein n=1 Tax=Candidatus Lokiarchaeum ossiferum TaxID=2951803 RepID=UPI00352FA8E0
MTTLPIITQLLQSKEPLIRLKTYRTLLDHELDTVEVKKICRDLKQKSPIVQQLFKDLPQGNSSLPYDVYHKWHGAHWIMAILADLEYPPQDKTLIPSRDAELEWLLSDHHWKRTPILEGRRRFCASIEGNAIFALTKLGLDDGRCAQLIQRLQDYQWEDGGWNCDKHPKACHSSYNESLIPYRALIHYHHTHPSPSLAQTIERASEVFLKRKLYVSQHTQLPIHPKWIQLSYPSYWHYNILNALKILGEGEKLKDPRCQPALDILVSKRLPDGGFPAEIRYYLGKEGRNHSPVHWGGVAKRKMNPWVTLDALHVLKMANLMDFEP